MSLFLAWLGVTSFAEGLFRDPVVQRAKTVLNSPMPGEPSLEYYRHVEHELLNRLIVSIQRLNLELKFFDLLTAEYETASGLLQDHEDIEEFLSNN